MNYELNKGGFTDEQKNHRHHTAPRHLSVDKYPILRGLIGQAGNPSYLSSW
jgi:hypothetical protein